MRGTEELLTAYVSAGFELTRVKQGDKKAIDKPEKVISVPLFCLSLTSRQGAG